MNNFILIPSTLLQQTASFCLPIPFHSAFSQFHSIPVSFSSGIPPGPCASLGCSFHIAGDSLYCVGGKHCDPQMHGDVTRVARGDMQWNFAFIATMFFACDLQNTGWWYHNCQIINSRKYMDSYLRLYIMKECIFCPVFLCLFQSQYG